MPFVAVHNPDGPALAAEIESTPRQQVPRPGEPAPCFTLPDADMQLFDLAQELGSKGVVLFFYPKDGTPVCVRHAVEFSDRYDDFARRGMLVVGISPDDCLTHAEFRDCHGLAQRLLSDCDGEVCRLYGAWQPGEPDGMKRLGVQRSTFIIDRGGIVRHALHDVGTRGHAAFVLDLVKDIARNTYGNR